jgi:hypothetical protein
VTHFGIRVAPCDARSLSELYWGHTVPLVLGPSGFYNQSRINHFKFRNFYYGIIRGNWEISHVIQCLRKVAVHLGYGTQIWLSVSKLPLKCAVVSLYSAVKQRLKCNTGKVCNFLLQFYSLWFFQLRNVFYKCTATFQTLCICFKMNISHTEVIN